MAKLFFSYSHDDEQYRDQLEKHLALLKHEGRIESWHDRRIVAGAVFSDVIEQELDAADIVLLLVSSSFIASPYCYSLEMRRAMERHEAGAARVIPVIVRPCDWHSAPFGKLQAVPQDGKAITTWPNFDEAYADVARKIRQALEELSPVSTRRVPTHSNTARAAQPSLPRSSNLRLKKEFTQLDADKFLRETFDFAQRFFEGSLQELERRNADIACDFRVVDGNTFTAAIYRHGKKASECSVHVGSGSFRHPSIMFSHDVSARGNSYNEALTVTFDDQEMYLKAFGMSRGDRDAKLSQEGAAELLWELLIGGLQ